MSVFQLMCESGKCSNTFYPVCRFVFTFIEKVSSKSRTLPNDFPELLITGHWRGIGSFRKSAFYVVGHLG